MTQQVVEMAAGIHQYAEIDLDQVVAAVGRARTDFRAYVRAIADGLAG